MKCTDSTFCLNLSAVKLTVTLLMLFTALRVIIQMRGNIFYKSTVLAPTSTLASTPNRLVNVSTSLWETNRTEEETNHMEYSIKDLSAFRVEKVRKHCLDFKKLIVKSYPNYNQIGGGLTNWAWMISPHHHLFYCAAAKCGSTTWKSYLMKDLKIEWQGNTHK